METLKNNEMISKSESDREAFGWLAVGLILLFAFACALSSGCRGGISGTITPVITRPSTPSIDGSEANSGILGTNGMWTVLSPHARDRAMALMVDYGKHWNPPVQPGDGIIPAMSAQCGDDKGWHTNSLNTFWIDREHWAKVLTANILRKSGVAPIK